MSENITIENLPKLETNIEADFSVPIKNKYQAYKQGKKAAKEELAQPLWLL